MKEVQITFNVYEYSELSPESKEKAKQWYLNDEFRNDIFHEAVLNDLEYIFPNSDLKVEYSLSSCQGDGLNICGTLKLKDLFTVFTNKEYCGKQFLKFWDRLTETEIKQLKEIDKKCGNDIEIPKNSYRYSYCVADEIDILDDLCDGFYFSEDMLSEEDIKLIRKLNDITVKLFTYLCKEYEKQGYEYLYEVDEEKFTNKRNPMTSKPAENVRFNGDSWNAFCDSYSIVITKESLGELERIDAAVDNYLDIENLMKAMNSLPCENICVSQLIAEAKGRGYKYKKSEIPDSGDFGYAVKYKDAYFKVGILDQAFSIINDGEPAEVYYGGAKGVTFIVTSIGIAGVLPFHPQNVNMKNKKVIVCE